MTWEMLLWAGMALFVIAVHLLAGVACLLALTARRHLARVENRRRIAVAAPGDTPGSKPR